MKRKSTLTKSVKMVDQTDWARLEAMADADIDPSYSPEIVETQTISPVVRRALLPIGAKQTVTLQLDADFSSSPAVA